MAAFDSIPWWFWLLLLWSTSMLASRAIRMLPAPPRAQGPVYLSPREGETQYVCDLGRAQDMAFDEEARREVDAIVGTE